MTAPGRPPQPPPATDRRGWLAQALAGAACATLAEPALAADDRGEGAAALPSKPPPKQNLLASLLDRNHQLRPDFGGGLSNHVSMALYSLTALGASAAQLDRFAEAHWRRLEPLPTDPGPRV